MTERFPKKLIEKNIWDMTRNGKILRYGNRVFWINDVTREVYALSADAYDSGVINGYKVGDVNEDYTEATKC